MKNVKIGHFWRVFDNLKLAFQQYYQTGQKLGHKLSDFQALWTLWNVEFKNDFVSNI